MGDDEGVTPGGGEVVEPATGVGLMPDIWVGVGVGGTSRPGQ